MFRDLRLGISAAGIHRGGKLTLTDLHYLSRALFYGRAPEIVLGGEAMQIYDLVTDINERLSAHHVVDRDGFRIERLSYMGNAGYRTVLSSDRGSVALTKRTK